MSKTTLKKYIPLSVKRLVKNSYHRLKVMGKPKIFCIGLNKTGTTSLKTEMQELGFMVGNQREAELMVEDWAKRDFNRLIKYCRTAQFFQDVPFSYPYTFIVMDQAFPGSKFILTIRDNAEEWYNSVIKFQSKLWGNSKVPPTSEDLKKANYIYKGRPYQTKKLVHNVADDDLYNKDILLDFYNTHNKNVMDYFNHRADDLLVINLKEKNSYSKFCRFLGIEQKKNAFPWENKT
jgi:hypothetical protein